MNPLWYEKYRPKTFDDYVWVDDELREKIQRWRTDNSKTPHLLLVGPPGVGKTTLALLLTSSMVNDDADVLFVRTSKDNGADMIRNSVDPFCQSAGWSELKFVIFDEAERLSLAAQEMLRDTFNAYGDHVRFIFTCNNSTKLKAFMDSRIRTIHFDGLDRDAFMERILTILVTEEVELDDSSIEIVQKTIDRYYPDMRKTIDMLEDCCVEGKLIESKRAAKVERPWMEGLVTHLSGSFDIKQLRDQIAEIPIDQMSDVYVELDQRAATLFGKDEGLAIVVIKDHMIRHQDAAFPALWLLGLFIELYYLKTGS